ncbi:hypothetical protein LZ31DRAFT_580810, partial [Colletotrichum somersetense]
MPSNILAGWDRLVVAVIVCLAAVVLSRRFVWSRSVTLKPKTLTFRVDDIPIDHANTLESNLRSIAERDPVLRDAAATIVRRSLAPKDKETVCATVSTTTPLSGEDLCARLRKGGRVYPYSYSCKFEG